MAARLGKFEISGKLWFGVIVLLIAILLIVLLITEPDNIYKYAEIVFAIFSAPITAISVAKRELIHQAVSIFENINWIYTGVVSFLSIFSLNLISDHFINNYERDSTG